MTPLIDPIGVGWAASDWCEQFGGRFGEVITALRKELREPAPLRADIAVRLRERLAKD